MSETINEREKSASYVWFDAEFTSLDLDEARFLQVAVVLTDPQLKRFVPEDDDINVFVKLARRQKVSAWVEENLGDCLAHCRSNKAVEIEEIDERLAAYLDEHIAPPSDEEKFRPVLAGNSIHNDWFLVRKFLPKFASRLHYRLLDVTALKLEWEHWFVGEAFDKENIALIKQYFPASSSALDGRPHDAYYDVHASIAELSYYRSQLRIR